MSTAISPDGREERGVLESCAQGLGSVFSANLSFGLCEGGGALLGGACSQDSAHPGSQRLKLPHHRLR